MSNIYDTAPAKSAVAVTPSDTTILPAGCRALSIGTGGHVAVEFWDKTTATYKNRASGSELIVKAKRVLFTGTTATDIVANY